MLATDSDRESGCLESTIWSSRPKSMISQLANLHIDQMTPSSKRMNVFTSSMQRLTTNGGLRIHFDVLIESGEV